MKLDSTTKKAALVCILVAVGIVGVYLLYGLVGQDTGVPGENETPDTLFRCFIIEYNENFTKDALVFHLTDADLEDHPEYREGMEAAHTSTMEWRDGKRYIYEVQDYSDEYLWSYNLCLANYSQSECRSHVRLYEYKGGTSRYGVSHGMWGRSRNGSAL